MALHDLYYDRRLDTSAMTPASALLWALWLPIGLPLALLRVAGVILASLVLPPRWRPPVVRAISGLWVTGRRGAVPPRGAVLAANHSSFVDPYTIQAAFDDPGARVAIMVWHRVHIINRLVGRPVIKVYPPGMNRDLAADTRAFLQTGNVILFPEGAVTDGHKGLLRFEQLAFELGAPIALVSIRYRRPFPFWRPMAMSLDLFREGLIDLAQPWVTAEVNHLGMFEVQPGESPAAAAQRAQTIVADALGQVGTSHTRGDRHAALTGERRTPRGHAPVRAR